MFKPYDVFFRTAVLHKLMINGIVVAVAAQAEHDGGEVIVGQSCLAQHAVDRCGKLLGSRLVEHFHSVQATKGMGLLLVPVLLEWMQVPIEVMPASLRYLRIYFSGVITMIMYNIFTSILLIC